MSLPNTDEHILFSCPACSSDEPTVHETLKSGGHPTARCTECSHVHKEKVEIPDETEINVVVPRNGNFASTEVSVPVGTTIEVGDGFIADTPETTQLMCVMGIEAGPEQHTDETEVAGVKIV